jgi:hypothetical protein
VRGLASYGRFKSYMTTIVLVLISVCCFAGGLTWARSSAADLHTATTGATIRNVSCSTNVVETRQKNGTVSRREDITCYGDAAYVVNGTSYTAQRLRYSYKVSDGDQVPVFYNPVNPNDVISQKPAPPVVGYMLAGGACLVGIGSIAYSVFISKSKAFAAIHGTREAIDDAGGLLRGIL